MIFLDEVKELGPSFFEIIFKDAIEAAEKYDAPLYCGEYGAIDLSDNPSKINWLRDIHTAFKNHGMAVHFGTTRKKILDLLTTVLQK